jgi:hypothetical protein
MRAISEQVTELETFVARLALAVRRGRSVSLTSNGTVAELQSRLDALEAAHAELSAIELRAGLPRRELS